MSSVDPAPAGWLPRWWPSLCAPQVWKRGACYGLPAGLIQAALNQGDHWVSGHFTAGVIAKSILSPLVGFAVAYLAALTTHYEARWRSVPSATGRSAEASSHGVS